MSEPEHKWVGVWKPIASFFLGVVVAAFTFGSRIQKVNDIVEWKKAIDPKIERMDSVGSLSFDHFHKQYEKDQARSDRRLEKLEESAKKLSYEH